MSVLFSFLLACYASVRLILWIRGQLRWLAIRKSLPVPPTTVDAPAHLSPGLSALFLSCRVLRVELVLARRLLAAVEVTDPDAPLGQVRDRRYRRALMESWSHIKVWLRAVDELERGDRLHFEARRLSDERTRALLEAMRGKWRQVARARALDAFAVADLVEVRRTLEQIEDELVAIERGLEGCGEDPYRDRYVTAPALSA